MVHPVIAQLVEKFPAFLWKLKVRLPVHFVETSISLCAGGSSELIETYIEIRHVWSAYNYVTSRGRQV
jgi:hypothetical protein